METSGRLPDFLIVGAMKAGTTSLARWLRAHPQVFMTGTKELHFFDTYWPRGVEWYAEQFASAPADMVAGEATPGYMLQRTFIDRMATVVPDARLVAVLRHPVDRAWSQYQHWVGSGRETRSFEAIVDEELAGGAERGRERRWPIARGRYIEQLRELAERYDRSRTHIGLFEDLTESPAAFFAEVCRFLGVDDAREPSIVGQRFDPRTEYKYPLLAKAINSRDLLSRLPSAAQRRVRDLVEVRPDKAVMLDDTRARLVEYFRPYNDELALWLGRDLSAWNR